jgi:23S rRNA pseudouridine2605 synthase
MKRSQPPRQGKSGRDRPRRREAENNESGERLQKVLAAAGIGSRRDCEELITAGRVEVDKQVVTELGTRVDLLKQEIRVDGESLRQPKRMYFAVNKPTGVVTTNYDPSGRTRVIDLIPTDERLFPVGRLDRFSEGLILVTNDGEFANRLTHPRYGVEKTYLVRVAGNPSPEELDKLRRGIHLSDGFCKIESLQVKRRHKQSTDLVIVLDEGRNREIRRVLAKVGHKVLQLRRVIVGNLKLGDMPTGAWRKLSTAEVESLLALAQFKRRKSRRRADERISTDKPTDKPAERPTGKSTGQRPAAEAGRAKPVRGERSENRYREEQERMAPQYEEVYDDVDEMLDIDEIVDFRSDDSRSHVPRGDVLEYFDEGAGPPPMADDDASHSIAKPRKPRRQQADSPRSDRPASRPRKGAKTGDRPRGVKPAGVKPAGAKPGGTKAAGTKPKGMKPTGAKPTGKKPFAKKPTGAKPSGAKSAGKMPFKGKGGRGSPPKKKGRR